MGMLLIVLGVASAGLVADFLVENHLTSAPSESIGLLGTSFKLSQPEVVLAAFVAGMLAIVFLAFGAKLARGRRGRRRALKVRVRNLEQENKELRDTAPLTAS